MKVWILHDTEQGRLVGAYDSREAANEALRRKIFRWRLNGQRGSSPGANIELVEDAVFSLEEVKKYEPWGNE